MRPIISIGAQSFEYIREQGFFLVDKSDFIKEWWENGDAVTLIIRSRRFGKTLNLNMLDCFFQRNMRAEEICLDCPYGKKSGTVRFRGVIR